MILYDKRGFFEEVLNKLRDRLAVGARKVRLGKKWYWMLKEDYKFGELNNISMARSYLRQAEERVKHAGEALRSGNYLYVMRQSQEAVELSLKASLRLVGIEPPKWHDVGPVLMQDADRFPKWFREKVPRMSFRKLRREPSMYGDEETGLPPEQLYTVEDAEEALSFAGEVYDLCRKLPNEPIK